MHRKQKKVITGKGNGVKLARDLLTLNISFLCKCSSHSLSSLAQSVHTCSFLSTIQPSDFDVVSTQILRVVSYIFLHCPSFSHFSNRVKLYNLIGSDWYMVVNIVFECLLTFCLICPR